MDFRLACVALTAAMLASMTVVANPDVRHIPPPIATALDNAEIYELLSIDPDQTNAGPTTSPASLFHGYSILGSTTVTDAAVRTKVTKAFLDAVIERHSNFTTCLFWPRHGLRLTTGDSSVDMVICFQCGEVRSFDDDQALPTFRIQKPAESVLDDVLRAAGVRLAEKN
jgi:hypothetical protein